MKLKIIIFNILGMFVVAIVNFLTAKLWGDVKYSVLVPSTITVLCFSYILGYLFYLEKRIDPFLINYMEKSIHKYITTVYDESLNKLESLKKKEIIISDPHMAQYEITRIVRSAKKSILATHLPEESLDSLRRKPYSWYDLEEWENANYAAAQHCKKGVTRIFIITEEVVQDKNKFNEIFDILLRQNNSGVKVFWVPITKLKKGFIAVKDYLIMDNMIVLENIGLGMANFRIIWKKNIVSEYFSLYEKIKDQSERFSNQHQNEDLLKKIKEEMR